MYNDTISIEIERRPNMNIPCVKEKLKRTYIKIAICIVSMTVFLMSGDRSRSLFEGVVWALYVYSLMTLLFLLYQKVKSVLLTALILVGSVICLIVIPMPKSVVIAIMIFLMFGGALYDLFYLVRLTELKIDFKRGKMDKWKELERPEDRLKQYSQEEILQGLLFSASKKKAKEAVDLGKRLNHQIELANKAWDKIYAGRYSSEAMSLRNEYDDFLKDSKEILDYLSSDYALFVISETEKKYDEIRDKYNRFQRIRRNLDWLAGNIKNNNIPNANVDSQPSKFFADCNTLDKLQKRYKDLCKVYHPDMNNGSAETFVQLQQEYERMKKTL